MLDSFGQSNNPSTFGIRDPDSGSLHTDADRRKALEQQARAEKENQQRSLASINAYQWQTETRNRPDCCFVGIHTNYRALQTPIYSFIRLTGPVPYTE